jgi:hypothetical protein
MTDSIIFEFGGHKVRTAGTPEAPLFRRSTDGTYRPVARVPVTPADILADLERPSRFAPDLAVPTLESFTAAARECVTRTVVGL